MWHHYQKLSACLSACTEGYTGKNYALDFSNPWLKFYNKGSHLCIYSVSVCTFIERIRPLNGTRSKGLVVHCYFLFLLVQSGTHSGMEDDPGIASPTTLSSRGGGGQMSPSTSETSESRCMYKSYLHCTTRIS